jgi:hypothetical protein
METVYNLVVTVVSKREKHVNDLGQSVCKVLKIDP